MICFSLVLKAILIKAAGFKDSLYARTIVDNGTLLYSLINYLVHIRSTSYPGGEDPGNEVAHTVSRLSVIYLIKKDKNKNGLRSLPPCFLVVMAARH